MDVRKVKYERRMNVIIRPLYIQDLLQNTYALSEKVSMVMTRPHMDMQTPMYVMVVKIKSAAGDMASPSPKS